ncbi:SDR family oxidoreductase [soil metagenome]
MKTPEPTLVVTGASGHFGGAVMHHLINTFGVAPSRITAVSRDPAKLATWASRGVKTVRGDFDDAESLQPAFAGAGRLLIISTDDLAPGKRLAQHLRAVAAAKAAHVGHVFYTSMLHPEPGSPVPFAPDHWGTEQALAASGMTVTVLRNNWYIENLMFALPDALKAGKWYVASGDHRVSYIARDDAARAAAGALATTDALDTIYEIVGSHAVTPAEIAALASEASGKPLEVVNVTPAQLKSGMEAAGVPAPMIPMFVSFEIHNQKGFGSMVNDAVRHLGGAKPRDISVVLPQLLRA